MAKIPDWHDIGPVNYSGPAMLTPHDESAMSAPGRATAQLGESIASAGKAIGGALASLEETNNSQEDLDTAMKFQNFQASQNDQFAGMKRDMPEDGTGFRDSFSKQYYQGAKDFISSVPNRLKSQYDAKLRVHHIEYEREARTAEYDQQDRYTTGKISGSLDKIYGDIDNSDDRTPDGLNRSIQLGQSIIDASPLPPSRKLELKKQFSNQAEKNYFTARSRAIDQMAADPNTNPEDIENERDQLEKEIRERGTNPLAPPENPEAPGAGDMPTKPITFEPNPTTRRVGTPRQQDIKGFVIHETQGSDNAAGNFSWSNKKNTGANYYIDKQGKIYQWAPDNVAMNHVGVGRNVAGDVRPDLGNANTLSVEIMTRPGEKPNAAQRDAARRLIMQKSQEYGFKAEDVEAHGRLAPGHKEVTEGTAVADFIKQNWSATPGDAPERTTQPTAQPAKALPDATVDSIVEQAAKDQGIDPDLMRSFAHIESGGDPKNGNERYHGLFGLSQEEFRKNGGRGSIFNAEANANAASKKIRGDIDAFKTKYDRNPTAAELYMIHQQGEAGAEAHWDHPDQQAWKSMLGTGEGQQRARKFGKAAAIGWAKRAIWGNLTDDEKKKFGYVDNVTSKEFTDFWTAHVAEMGGNKIAPEQPDGAQTASALPMANRGMTFGIKANEQRAAEEQGMPTQVASLEPGTVSDTAPAITPGAQAVMQAGLPITVQDKKGATAAEITPENNIATVLDGVPDNIPLSQVPADVRYQVYGMFPKEALAAKTMQDGSKKSALDVMTVGAVKEALASQLRQTKRVADASGGLFPSRPTFNYITENDRLKMLKQLESDRKAYYDQWSNAEAAYIAKFGEPRADSTGQTLLERAVKSLPGPAVAKIKQMLDRAHGIFAYVNPMKEHSDDEIDETIQSLQASPSDSPDVAAQKQAVLSAATTEANRIRTLRQKDLAAASNELPEVKAAQATSREFQKSLVTGTDVNGDPVYTADKKAITDAQTKAWEGVIQARLDAQEKILGDSYNPKDSTSNFRLLTRQERSQLFNGVKWNKLTELQQQQALAEAAQTADARYGKFARQAFNEAVQQIVTGEESLESAGKISADLMGKMAREEAITSADVNRLNNARDMSPMETFARGGVQSNPDWNAPANWNGSGRFGSPMTTGRMGSDGALPAIAQPGNASLSQAPQKAISWLLKDPIANSSAFDRMYGAGTSAQIIKLMQKLQSPIGAGASQ